MDAQMHKISLALRKDQYELLSRAGINVSGLIRDLIDDRFSKHTITITVSQETRALYDQIVSHTEEGDVAIEPYFRRALREMLKEKIKGMEKLQRMLDKD